MMLTHNRYSMFSDPLMIRKNWNIMTPKGHKSQKLETSIALLTFFRINSQYATTRTMNQEGKMVVVLAPMTQKSHVQLLTVNQNSL